MKTNPDQMVLENVSNENNEINNETNEILNIMITLLSIVLQA